MATLTEKIKNLVESASKQSGVEVGIDIVSGSVALNGIVFTQQEQSDLVKYYKNDVNMSKLLSQINKTPEADKLRSVVSFNGGKFEVDAKAANKVFGTNLPEKDEKDLEIERLRKQIESLEGQLQSKVMDSLTYPDNFEHNTDFHNTHISNEVIQLIIDDLEGVEVPEYSFVAHRTGDVIVLKLNDDQGISYIVTNDYFYKHIG